MNTSRGTREMDVNVLHTIDSELESENVAALKFLCSDIVPRKQLQKVRDGRDLFLKLEERGLLGDDCLIVAELLITIQRFDLLRHLRLTRVEAERSLSSRRGSYTGISPYRKILYNLAEDVTEDNLRTIKHLLQLPRGKLEPSVSFLDLLVEMEKQGLLGEDHLEELERVLDHVDKRLAARLQSYAAQRAGGGIAHRFPDQESSVNPFMESSSYISSPSEETGAHEPIHLHQPQNPSVPESSGSFSPGAPVHSHLSVDAGPVHSFSIPEPQHVYSMARRPCGHCVIINNHHFGEARKNRNLKVTLADREGTDIDARALTSIFSRLHFTVHQRNDVTGVGLQEVANEFGAMGHGALDAFVCCVLSHGKKGAVYGTDGEAVPIRGITLPFTSSRCPSLAKKPKLFFIQACQAQEDEEDGGAPRVQGDGEGGWYDSDAGRCVPDTIPNDSDFLLGMATVEDHKSFRHTVEGSAFIQELCRQLESGCRRNQDILTIMTNVNREVSGRSFGRKRQMPEPRYTLTKKLILPLD
ncbi:caspase-8-like isoform X2 [Megalops cyprinoides]|uniref:caspase-8-like isoform X2 n=1 Tax=Megalops cyprinoides TaxID=118141 RepID=UPI00186485DA|nr:caspase-8-like isoform X2 [Megalops cyprinoides]